MIATAGRQGPAGPGEPRPAGGPLQSAALPTGTTGKADRKALRRAVEAGEL